MKDQILSLIFGVPGVLVLITGLTLASILIIIAVEQNSPQYHAAGTYCRVVRAGFGTDTDFYDCITPSAR